MLRVFILIPFLITTSAFAGFLVEPYASFAMLTEGGTAKVNGETTDLDDSKLNGLIFGGRLGYGVGSYGAGLDYATTLTGGDEDVKLSTLGVFGLMAFPVGRFWGTYILKSDYKTFDDDLDEDLVLEGSGFKFGYGYEFLPGYSLNFEYMMLNYDKESVGGLSGVDFDVKGFLIGVSIPWVFGGGV